MINKTNTKFVDPKWTLLYQIGTSEFRKDMRKLERQNESLKRLLQAIEWQENIPELPEEETRYHVNRDERVVLRGGVVYKDTHMWSPP